jgi:putative transposase
VSDKIENGAGASSRGAYVRPEGRPAPFRHLAHVPSFRDNPTVFFTTYTYVRGKILASSQCHKILTQIWQRSAAHDGWWVGNYIIMPDHVHFFARPEIGAPTYGGMGAMWKSVSSRRIAAAFSIKPPIWQSEYFDRYLRSGENYSEKMALRSTNRSAGRPSRSVRSMAVSRDDN